MTPLAFLQLLWDNKPDEHYILLWTLKDKQSHWFQSIASAAEFVEKACQVDVYVGVGLSQSDRGPGLRCTSTDVVGITGFWADFDFRSDAHPKATLPVSIEQALSILPPEFPPSIVVLTGNGAHIWWLLREPWIFESAEEHCAAATLVSRWHTLLRDNASQRGWTYERLADLARVLRVPGTTNCKDSSNPKPVIIESQSDRRYNPSELADYLDDLSVPDPEAEAAAAQEWAQRFQDKPLIINLSARISEECLNRWLDADSRFKGTWFRQRQDLHDQSQSGYDLALACFGFSAGFTEQEIVDLIVHHRALHKQRQRTRLDYFQRTISKAASPTHRSHEFGTPNGPAGAGPSSSKNSQHCGGTPEPDAAVKRAAACNILSGALGVQIYRITKIKGHSPIFYMDLAEGKAEFSNVGKLISQTAMRNTLAGITCKLMRRFKPKEWEMVAQALLDACTDEEGGEEMEMEGSARLRLVQYLSATAYIDSLDEQSRDNSRKPMVADGFITVCSSDIHTFINKTTSENVTIPMVVGMLSAVGAKTKRFRGKFPEQSRWLLPPDKFSAAEFGVPAGEELSDDNQ